MMTPTLTSTTKMMSFDNAATTDSVPNTTITSTLDTAAAEGIQQTPPTINTNNGDVDSGGDGGEKGNDSNGMEKQEQVHEDVKVPEIPDSSIGVLSPLSSRVEWEATSRHHNLDEINTATATQHHDIITETGDSVPTGNLSSSPTITTRTDDKQSAPGVAEAAGAAPSKELETGLVKLGAGQEDAIVTVSGGVEQVQAGEADSITTSTVSPPPVHTEANALGFGTSDSQDKHSKRTEDQQGSAIEQEPKGKDPLSASSAENASTDASAVTTCTDALSSVSLASSLPSSPSIINPARIPAMAESEETSQRAAWNAAPATKDAAATLTTPLSTAVMSSVGSGVGVEETMGSSTTPNAFPALALRGVSRSTEVAAAAAVMGERKDNTQSSSGGTTTTTATTTLEPSSQSHNTNIDLLSLPLDSLHHVAGFLTPREWSRIGQTSWSGQAIVVQIWNRVWWHAFQCTTQVVAAWQAGQYADAKELAALYISSGVPIYPNHNHQHPTHPQQNQNPQFQPNSPHHSQRKGHTATSATANTTTTSSSSPASAQYYQQDDGRRHAYRTLVWRMKIQAKQDWEMAASQPEAQRTTLNTTVGGGTFTTNTSRPPLTMDSFFVERSNFRSTQGYSAELTYLEEKALFLVEQKLFGQNGGAGEASLLLRQRNHNLRQRFLLRPPQGGTGGGGGGVADLVRINEDNEDDEGGFEGGGEDTSVNYFYSKEAATTTSSSSSLLHMPIMSIPIHRHLLDQHEQSLYCVDDQEETMPTAPLSLSVDFFHHHQQQQQQQHDLRGGGSGNFDLRSQGPDSRATAGKRSGRRTPTFGLSGREEPVHVHTDGHPDDDPDAENMQEDGPHRGLEQRRHLHPAANVAEPHQQQQEVGGRDEDDDEDHRGRFHPLEPPRDPQDPAAATGASMGLPPPSPARLSAVLRSAEFEPYTAESLFFFSSSASAAATQQGAGTDTVTTRTVEDDHDVLTTRMPGDTSTATNHSSGGSHKTFVWFEQRLKECLARTPFPDYVGFGEYMLDFWDECFHHTALIHYFDSHTAIPRASRLEQFLTRPCPKAIGIVQCEIERIRMTRGRFFPTYEYRLFLRHYPPPVSSSNNNNSIPTNNNNNNAAAANGAGEVAQPNQAFDGNIGNAATTNMAADDSATLSSPSFVRRDLLLLVAKPQGRNKPHHYHSSSLSSFSSSLLSSSLSSGPPPAVLEGKAPHKKGANSYCIYLPQLEDVEAHFNQVNDSDVEFTPLAAGQLQPQTPVLEQYQRRRRKQQQQQKEQQKEQQQQQKQKQPKVRPNKTNSNQNDKKLNNNSNSSNNNLNEPGDEAVVLMGRLQANFIGTEFQLFIPRPRILKSSQRPPPEGSAGNIRSPKRDAPLTTSTSSPALRTSTPPPSANLRPSVDEEGYDSEVSLSDNATTSTAAPFSPSSSRTTIPSRFGRRFLRTNSPGSRHRSHSSPSSTLSSSRRSRSVPRSSSTTQMMNTPITAVTAAAMATEIPPQSPVQQQQQQQAPLPQTAPTPDGKGQQGGDSIVIVEEEDGVITYTANLLGSRPRIMDVCIPKVSPDGVVGAEWKRYLNEMRAAAAVEAIGGGAGSVDDLSAAAALLLDQQAHYPATTTMLQCFKQLQQRLEALDPQQPRPQGGGGGEQAPIGAPWDHPPLPPQQQQQQQQMPAAQGGGGGEDLEDSTVTGNSIGLTSSTTATSATATTTSPHDFGLLALQNRPPWWNVELGSFVLNFGGRVSVASVKNFQLCDRNNQDDIMLQFGRIQGRHSFTMDFQHPLTAVQAFSIAISSLQSKISFG